MSVPGVLLSGNHAEIEKWRLARQEEKTRLVRPDLLK
jgi:tRNA (guanine37-N1)-methyltransferase